MIARASSSRSFSISQRGDSGRNRMPIAKMSTGNTWNNSGKRPIDLLGTHAKGRAFERVMR